MGKVATRDAVSDRTASSHKSLNDPVLQCAPFAVRGAARIEDRKGRVSSDSSSLTALPALFGALNDALISFTVLGCDACV